MLTRDSVVTMVPNDIMWLLVTMGKMGRFCVKTWFKDDEVVNALRDFLDNQILEFPQMTFVSDTATCYKQTPCVYAFKM